MSFAEIAAQLDRVVDLAEQALRALRQASDSADDCKKLIAESTAGTTQESEAATITANFDAVHSGALDQGESLAAALSGVERIRAALQVHPTATEPAPALRVEQSWAERQRQRLPAYITSGVYLDPDGYTELVQSGREPDGEHERINAHLVAVGAIPPIKIEAPKHVEMKVAWRMRQGRVNRVDLVINRAVCEGMNSCTELVPDVLLPGQTLVVHDPLGSFEIHGKDAR